jgi:hypothetical protein
MRCSAILLSGPVEFFHHWKLAEDRILSLDTKVLRISLINRNSDFLYNVQAGAKVRSNWLKICVSVEGGRFEYVM